MRHPFHQLSIARPAARLCGIAVMLATTASVFGQDSGSIARALLALRTLNGRVSTINGRLYGGSIDSTIQHLDNEVNDVTDNDLLSLRVVDRGGSQAPVTCGTREQPLGKAAFDACVRRNIDALIRILFPASLSTSVSGRDAAQDHSQLFLLTTALGLARPQGESRQRSDIGGLVEHEWFSAGGLSGDAWQGLYQLNGIPLSFHGRYARQQDSVHTRSVNVSADFHPSWSVASALDWRLGIDARSSLLYSRSSALNSDSGITPLELGSLDAGGGVWTSTHKDFSRLRLSGATLFQGTKSHVPSRLAANNLRFVADAMNDRPMTWDIAYGGLVGFLSSEHSSINGRFMETRPVDGNAAWPRPPARLAMVSFSYLFGGTTPIDAGYKISTAGGIRAHSVFMQGNFRW
jgi:hypothetical protein